MKIEHINFFRPPEYLKLEDKNIRIVVSEKGTKGAELDSYKIDLFF